MDTSDSQSQESLLSESIETCPETVGLQRPSCYRRWVTVEPCLMLYFMASIGLAPLTDQYVLHFIQKQNNFSFVNQSQCIHNMSDPNYIKEQGIQSQASRMVTLFSVVALIPSVLITTQLGGYSDKAGRKIVLICPTIGAILRCLLSALIVYIELPLPVFNAAYLVEGFLGGIATFIMACFAYVADVTTHGQRSLRIFLLEVAIGIGIIGSSISTGYLIQALGFMYPFLILCGIHALNLLYIIIILRESVKKDLTARFLTLKYYSQMLILYFRDDGTSRRWKLLLSLLILFLFCMPQLGGMDVLNYFQLDSPICFNSVDIGLWQAARYVVVSVSGILALKLLHYRLGDMGLMVMGCVFSIAFYLWLAFIKTKLVMYLATLGAIFTTLSIPVIRSFSSKIVQPNEQGVMFSAIAVAQVISVPVASVTLNTIYSATVSNMKGMTFLVQAGMMLLCLLLVIALIFGLRIERKHQRTSETEQ